MDWVVFECVFCNQKLNIRLSGIKGHMRWCKDNPERDDIAKKASIAASKQMVARHANGWKAPKHTEEAKEKIRKKALSSKHRRLVKSVRKYVCKNGEVVQLDSSWEEALAKRLDFLNIRWTRPKEPLVWYDNDTPHHYFPDFWLEDFKLFLDPKNPAAFKQQAKKVKWLKENIKNVVFLTTLEECVNYIPAVGYGAESSKLS